MAEETQAPPAAAPAPEVVTAVKDQPPPPQEETVKEEGSASVEEPEKPKEETKAVDQESKKISGSASFKEESNIVSELPEGQKKALEEFKKIIQEALNKHEFTSPPRKDEEKKIEEKTEAKTEEKTEKAEEVKEEEKAPEATPPPKEEHPKPVETAKTEKTEEKAAEVKEEEKAPEATPPPKEEPPKPVETGETSAPPPPVEEDKTVAVEKVAAETDDGAKTVEAIKETVVATAAKEEKAPPQPTQEAAAAAPEEPAQPPPPPEEVSIWGIPLLADERSDVILLKFLRARDFKVKEAFTMIKNTVRWRKEFGIDALLEEDLGNEYEKVVFTHGVDKKGHPVCYNVYGAFQDKELYQNCFGDDERRKKFLKWRIQFLEKSIRKLDFSPSGINTIVQVNDLKNSPGLTKKELRQATNQALNLLQDNYPEFVAKQVFINVPWWYLAFNLMISPFLTQRTKSKFVFSGPAKTVETLFKYIAPEQVPVQFGGLSKEGEQEFTVTDPVTEVIIKPTSKHTIEFAIAEKCQLVWELRVIGWDVNYGAEFIPAAEAGYTVIVSKSRKVTTADEPVISDTFKINESGKVVITIDNQTSKKKKLLYRSKTKSLAD